MLKDTEFSNGAMFSMNVMSTIVGIFGGTWYYYLWGCANLLLAVYFWNMKSEKDDGPNSDSPQTPLSPA